MPTYSQVSAELTELTGIIVVVAAHAMGNVGLDAKSLREDATGLLINWLRSRDTFDIDLRSVIIDDGGKSTARTKWNEYVEEKPKPSKKSQDGATPEKRSAVVLPLDGATSVTDGRAGGMSWFAMGDAASFSPASQWLKGHAPLASASDLWCLVITCGARSNPSIASALEKLVGQPVTDQRCTLAHYLRLDPKLSGVFPPEGVLAAHTMETGQFRYAHPPVGVPSYGRRLDGSAAVSAIAAFTQKTDIGYCVCRYPAIPVIAAAARTTGGAMVVVPLSGNGSAEPLTVETSARYMGAGSFITPDAEIVVVGGSITEICITDRVRWNGSSWRPTRTPPRPKAPRCEQYMSFHSVVMDTSCGLYEERMTDWDVSRVKCFNGQYLQDIIRSHKARWDDKYLAKIETLKHDEETKLAEKKPPRSDGDASAEVEAKPQETAKPVEKDQAHPSQEQA